MNQVAGFSTSIEVTPTVSTSPAYSAEDQVGGLQTLDGAAATDRKVTTLVTIVVVDKGKQNAALAILFFDSEPTVVSVDNGAVDVSDAELASKCVGSVDVAATDYEALANASVATVKASSLGLAMKSKNSSGKLYALVKTSGTPTYASTSDLVFKYVFAKDL